MKLIPLTKGQHAIVDDQDFERVAAHRWYLNGRGYAITSLYNPKRTVSLHRFVMNAPKGAEVDHENRNKLDCRRENLRWSTRAGNARNVSKRRDGVTSQYKGVHLHREGKYEAGIRVNRKRIYLGLYVTQEEAAHAYDQAATKHHGEFAALNFPLSQRDYLR